MDNALYLQAITTDIPSLHGVQLLPLSMAHSAALQNACQDGRLWEDVLTSTPDPSTVEEYIKQARTTTDRVGFAVCDQSSNTVVGTTSYYHILPKLKRLNIGYTWYAQSYWRTHVNTACKLMLLTQAFETLGCLTVGWTTDTDNIRSQRAIERLGAKKDGVIRRDRIRRNGVITDSVVYRMTHHEWPTAKATLHNKLRNPSY